MVMPLQIAFYVIPSYQQSDEEWYHYASDALLS